MLPIDLAFRLARSAGAVAAAFLLLSFLGNQPACAQTEEFRAFWVDAFHAGFKTSTEVSTFLSNIRAANGNAVIVELRKRGDAYYTPDTAYADYEPHATDTTPANFDSLADLISKAHDTSGSKRRIEVHVWLVTWPIWGSTTPPSNPQHPFNRRPEWLTQDPSGATWNGSQYCFDAGHPGAFAHTFRIAMNLVTNYDLDGLNFDYVRYAGKTWGYNPTAVSRFHTRYGGSGTPATTDPNWLQFRRDQVTAFIRKVYLNAIASKPNVKISADTITWAPGPANLPAWYSTAAYSDVLQDWRGWMEEGILDLNIPMAYFDQAGNYTQDWTNWCNFTRDFQYNRQAVIGPGIYLNATSNAITQMRYTRALSPAGNSVRGVCGYSYAVPDKNSTSFTTFLQYLTSSPNSYDPLSPAIFAQPASVPAMPWKTSPANGHLMGTVFSGTLANPTDGAVVTLSGPSVSRTQTNDGTGFFGFVDLPPGPYRVSARMTGFGNVTNSVSVDAGMVTNVILILSTNDTTAPAISGVQALNVSDAAVTIAWTTDESADSKVDYGLTSGYGTSVSNAVMTLSHSLDLAGLLAATTYHYRVRSRDASGNEGASSDRTFVTNPSGVVNDIIIDNPSATVVGSWSTGSSAIDRYGTDYRYKSQGTGASYLEYTPSIVTPGNYQVYEWHSVGGNRTTAAPFVIQYNGGSRTVSVNEQLNGGEWNVLGSFNFLAGTSGHIRITDAFPDAGQVVIADAVKLVYVPPLIAPTITLQPQSQTAKVTSNVTFVVSATGTTPLAFQWLFQGAPIPGATATTYARYNVQTNNAGTYAVIVTNLAGSTASSPALLSVLPLQPPVIVQDPRDMAAVAGGSASFSVSASSASPLRYQWLFTGLELPQDTLSVLSRSPVQPGDFGTYAVRVGNDDGMVLSAPAALRLAASPRLSGILANANLRISFWTESGPNYALEFGTGLPPSEWQSLTNISGADSLVTVDDAVPGAHRFYRVRVWESAPKTTHDLN